MDVDAGVASVRSRSEADRVDIDDGSRPAAVTGLCADGPMAGTEVRVAVDGDGEPPAVIAVDGHTYVLAMQSSPVIGRPWRYTVFRDGDLYVIDGGAPTP